VGFVVFGVPLLMRASGSWQLGMVLLWLSAPLVSTTTDYLQRPDVPRSGLAGFVRSYLLDLLDLGARLLFILAILPWIAARLTLVIGAIFALAVLAMFGVGASQWLFGWHVDGITDFSTADLVTSAWWLLATTIGMALVVALLRGLEAIGPGALEGAERAREQVRRWLAHA
jgi:hypothetical protein